MEYIIWLAALLGVIIAMDKLVKETKKAFGSVISRIKKKLKG